MYSDIFITISQNLRVGPVIPPSTIQVLACIASDANKSSRFQSSNVTASDFCVTWLVKIGQCKHNQTMYQRKSSPLELKYGASGPLALPHHRLTTNGPIWLVRNTSSRWQRYQGAIVLSRDTSVAPLRRYRRR